MKNIALIILIFTGIFTIQGQVIEWSDSTHFDFGEIQQGIDVQHVFLFTNQLAKPIQIETVRTDCGCTETEWDEKMLEPHQSGQIIVKYDAYRRGYFKKKIRVFFKKVKRSQTLIIEGFVK